MSRATASCRAKMSSILRVDRSPHVCELVVTSINSAPTTSVSPRCATRPVTTARTFSAFAIAAVSAVLPWYENAWPRGTTLTLLNFARLLIRLSVMPSPR